MASTLLEQTREAHEECERLERFIVSDLKTEAITHEYYTRRARDRSQTLKLLNAMKIGWYFGIVLDALKLAG